ncbi:hypothetical protein PSP6_270241 [Paraburkholderia tropica]|nr:hypothetical protein PSP6_270241 [Paraburkholderia tropica]
MCRITSLDNPGGHPDAIGRLTYRDSELSKERA